MRDCSHIDNIVEIVEIVATTKKSEVFQNGQETRKEKASEIVHNQHCTIREKQRGTTKKLHFVGHSMQTRVCETNQCTANHAAL